MIPCPINRVPFHTVTKLKTLTTNTDGAYSYQVKGGPSRTLCAVYDGTTILRGVAAQAKEDTTGSVAITVPKRVPRAPRSPSRVSSAAASSATKERSCNSGTASNAASEAGPGSPTRYTPTPSLGIHVPIRDPLRPRHLPIPCPGDNTNRMGIPLHPERGTDPHRPIATPDQPRRKERPSGAVRVDQSDNHAGRRSPRQPIPKHGFAARDDPPRAYGPARTTPATRPTRTGTARGIYGPRADAHLRAWFRADYLASSSSISVLAALEPGSARVTVLAPAVAGLAVTAPPARQRTESRPR